MSDEVCDKDINKQKEHIIIEWNHLCRKINWKKSVLDDRAIKFVKEFPNLLGRI